MFSNVLSLRINNRIITNIVYILIFSYLILFSIFNSLYIDKGVVSDTYRPEQYDIDNIAVKPVKCSFPLSGQYETTPRYICYILLIVTIIVRNHEWLAAGAAAWVLTYSGVAAIHMVVLFAKNQTLNPSKTKSHCELLSISDASPPFVACAGVYDPDVDITMDLVSSVMLGALPAAAWSTTFEKSTSKSILIFWLLLLAVGHTFFTLITTDRNRSIHFQICLEDYTESSPGANYQAPYLDQSWRESFYSLTRTAQQQPRSLDNGSLPGCIYSCFATAGYLGRKTQDIMVIDDASSGAFNDLSVHRRNIIMFWWVYTLIAFVILLTTEKKTYLPHWVHKVLFSFQYRRTSLEPEWRLKTVVGRTFRSVKFYPTSDGIAPLTKVEITILILLQLVSQLICLFAFLGSIIYDETGNAQIRNAQSQESFSAVGQWSHVAVVLLVISAAVIGRYWTGRRDKKDDTLSGGKTSITGDTTNGPRGVENGDEEIGEKDWDWHIGYAS